MIAVTCGKFRLTFFSEYRMTARLTGVDPTRTGRLRQRFVRDLERRFDAVQQAVVSLVISRNGLVANTRWSNMTPAQKMERFQVWLNDQCDKHILTPEQAANWYRDYSAAGYYQGQQRSYDDAKKPALQRPEFYAGGKKQFLEDAFNNRASQEKIDFLAARTYTELHGVTDDMSQKMARVLADGIEQGHHPRVVAKNMTEVMDISRKRATTIARTETIRAHAKGQLDALRRLGVTHVGVAVEWATAHDERVCRLCAALDGIVLTIDEAEGLIPRHPNCRCCFTPANVGEYQGQQTRTAVKIRAAIDRSLLAERRRGVGLRYARSRSRWTGANRRIRKNRPQPIVRPLEMS